MSAATGKNKNRHGHGAVADHAHDRMWGARLGRDHEHVGDNETANALGPRGLIPVAASDQDAVIMRWDTYRRISRRLFRPRIVLVGLLLALVAIWLSGAASPLLERIDSRSIEAVTARAGPWGPLLIIGLMTLAVVASPIPSAPIALAAGAAYGHYAGAIYVAIGAELGAVIAFLIARLLGRDAVLRLFGSSADRGLLGSQNVLTLTVFASRLMPFISFDAISYAAGLSRLHFWRFTIATLAGIAPASFVLAHFGSEAIRGEAGQAAWFAAGLGLVTGAPLLWIALRKGSGASSGSRRQAASVARNEDDVA